MLAAGDVRVDKFQLHKFPLDGVHEAIDYQKKGKTIKSMIVPGS
jgi:Zn-dependent alcohol dehydrogenase